MARRRGVRSGVVEVAVHPQMKRELAKVDKDLGKNVRSYQVGKCTAVVSFSDKSGWYLSIAHPDRTPTWKEVRQARGDLVPSNAKMSLIIDPEFPIGHSTKNFHLWEVDSIYKKPHIDPSGRLLGDEK